MLSECSRHFTTLLLKTRHVSGAIPFMEGTHRMKDSEGQNSSEGKCPRMMKMFLDGKE